MYKVLAALSMVLGLSIYGLIELSQLEPTPTANEVLGEKSTVVHGTQVAVLLPNNLTNKQHQILNRAYLVAKADGHPSPELVQSVLLQETHAGELKSFKVAGNKGDEYYGLGQIKIGAAREVMAAYPTLWAQYQFHTKSDDELKANLILNESFNIEITSKYLRLLQTRYGFRGRELVNAYNRGPGGVKLVDDGYHYAIGAEEKLAGYKKIKVKQ